MAIKAEDLKKLFAETFKDIDQKKLDDLAKAIANISEQQQKAADSSKSLFETYTELQKATEELNKAEGNWLKNAQAKIIHEEKSLEFWKKYLEKYDEAIKKGEKLGELNEEQIKILKENTEKLKERVESQDNLNEKTEDYIKQLLGANSGQSQFIVNLAKSSGGIDNIGIGLLKGIDHFTSWQGVVQLATKSIDMGMNILIKTFQRAIEVQALLAEKFKESGLVSSVALVNGLNKVANAANATGNSLAMAGISTEQLIAAYSTLRGESAVAFEAMANNNKEFAESLTKVTAEFSALGVNASTTSKIIDTMTLSLGMASKNAGSIESNLQMLATTAQKVGVSVSKFATDFASSMSKLAAQGDNAFNVFTNLEKKAKTLGIEFNNLLGLAEKFDTFEGAASAAGSLNAVLGGDYLNSLQMLNATEDERIQLIKESLQMSGQSFESLDKYSKKALAATLGISDMNEAAKLFSDQQTESSSQQIAYNEMLEASSSLSQKFDATLKQLYTSFTPIIKALEFLVDGFNKFITYLTDLSPYSGLVIALGLIVGGFYAMRLALQLISQQFVTKIASVQALGIAYKDLAVSAAAANTSMAAGAAAGPGISAVGAGSAAPGMAATGGAAASAVGPLLAFGAAILMIGGAVYIAAVGISKLADSLAKLNPEQLSALKEVMFILAGTFVILGIAVLALSPAVGPLLAFGAAILAIGLSIFLAATGFQILVKSLNDIAKLPIKDISAAISELAWPITKIGIALLIAAPGLLLGGTGFLIFSAAISIASVGIFLLSKSLAEISKISFVDLLSSLVGIAGAFAIFASIMTFVGPALSAASKDIIIFGVGLVLISGSLFIAAKAFKELQAIPFAELATGIGLMVATAAALGFIGAGPLGTGLLIVGAGFLALGVAVLAAGAGFALVSKSFAILAKTFVKFTDGFKYMIKNVTTTDLVFLAGMGLAFLGAGVGFLSGALGLGSLALGLAAFNSVVKDLEINKMKEVLNALNEAAEKFAKNADAFTKFGSSLKEMSEGLENFDKVQPSIIAETAKVSPEQLDKAKQVLEVGVEYNKSKALVDALGNVTSTLAGLTRAVAGSSEPTATETTKQPIVIMIKDAELAKVLIDMGFQNGNQSISRVS